jgi:hypothetical protein
VIENADGTTVWSGVAAADEPDPGWLGCRHVRLDFSAFSAAGRYRVRLGEVRSPLFPVVERLLRRAALVDAVAWFKIQRLTGAVGETFAVAAGEGPDPVDVSGGWMDASCDWSRNLSHLRDSRFLCPQQQPLPVWTLLAAAETVATPDAVLRYRLRDEATWGADGLVRLVRPDGALVFNALFNVRDFATKQHPAVRLGDFDYPARTLRPGWRAGMREGAGLAIAALARAAAAGLRGAFSADDYRTTAERAFAHLLAEPGRHLPEGIENILDDACALLAATELHRASGTHLDEARRRAERLCTRVVTTGEPAGWLRSDDADRPFYHPSDEGLPILALLRYAETEPAADRVAAARMAVARHLAFHLAISDVPGNPFGLARQFARAVGDAQCRVRWFMPHRNETGYWWQGENARLASLAAAFHAAADSGIDVPADRLRAVATQQVAWILGCNPFDACLMNGRGWNNVEYAWNMPNMAGGICNGITADPADESQPQFSLASPNQGLDLTWRWNEQWLPHGAWFVLAAALADRAWRTAAT